MHGQLLISLLPHITLIVPPLASHETKGQEAEQEGLEIIFDSGASSTIEKHFKSQFILDDMGKETGFRKRCLCLKSEQNILPTYFLVKCIQALFPGTNNTHAFL